MDWYALCICNQFCYNASIGSCMIILVPEAGICRENVLHVTEYYDYLHQRRLCVHRLWFGWKNVFIDTLSLCMYIRTELNNYHMFSGNFTFLSFEKCHKLKETCCLISKCYRQQKDMLNLQKNKYTTIVCPRKFWLHAIRTLNLLGAFPIGVRSDGVPYNPM